MEKDKKKKQNMWSALLEQNEKKKWKKHNL